MRPRPTMAGWIAPAVAPTTRVCVYDRAGKGWSDPAPEGQDGVAVVSDLHTLLERHGEIGPFVIAGHSSGGVYAQAFAATYPDEVAGLVLIDSQPASALTRLPGYDRMYSWLRRAERHRPLGVPLRSHATGDHRDGRIAPRAPAERGRRLRILGRAGPQHPRRARRPSRSHGAGPDPHDARGQARGGRDRRGGGPGRVAPPSGRDGRAVDQQRPPRGPRRHPQLAGRGRDGRRQLQRSDPRRRGGGARPTHPSPSQHGERPHPSCARRHPSTSSSPCTAPGCTFAASGAATSRCC